VVRAALRRAVVALLALGLLLPLGGAVRPQAALAAGSCTGWGSRLEPPPTVRVGRSDGSVETVEFRLYVGVVMAAEWPGWVPRQAREAGAVAVKQYAWYYSVFYRGWLAPDGRCFHVMDTSMDQVYWPELRVPAATQQRAITATWRLSLQAPRATGSRLILTSYRQGLRVACASDRDGLKLFQLSAQACGVGGLTARQILRAYYGGPLELVEPARHPGRPGLAR
jgi:hypothetical protein